MTVASVVSYFDANKVILLQGLVSPAVEMYRPVAECYEGQSVFMTGGTGFLGKVNKILFIKLVEKL